MAVHHQSPPAAPSIEFGDDIGQVLARRHDRRLDAAVCEIARHDRRGPPRITRRIGRRLADERLEKGDVGGAIALDLGDQVIFRYMVH
ncbi:hypothetical protein [Bradyrhizobium sp. P5_C11_2]